MFFQASEMLFKESEKEKIKNTVVGIVGIGGIGCCIVELLTRLGFQNFKLADFDTYSESNLNRQLFATLNTLNKNKALVGKERILSINPNAKVETFETGIDLSNVRDFCRDLDILLPQADKESAKIILHKAAQEFRIPTIEASRCSIKESRWKISSTLYDYKLDIESNNYFENHHEDYKDVAFSELNQENLDYYDQRIAVFKQHLYVDLALNSPKLFSPTMEKENLMKKIQSDANFSNHTVCSVIANSAGCLAATMVLRYILGCCPKKIEQDLMYSS